MKKKFIIGVVISAIIMLMLPWLAVTFVKGDAGMAACFLLFYTVNPLYSVIIGFFAGRDMKYLWSQPVISAALFLAGVWIFFSMKESLFIMYAIIYLIVGIAAMLLSMFIHRNIRKRYTTPSL